MKILSIFLTILMVQLFYSFGITLIVYSMPSTARHSVDMFSDLSNNINVQDTATQIEDSLTKQTSIPLVDIGALVFYSSSIIIDLILNFIFAIPQMFVLLMNAISSLFMQNIDPYIMATLQMFISAVILVWYVMGLLQFFSGVVSGRIE